jgi:hypothetical protein
MFFFKKSKIYIDAFLSEKYTAAFESAPIKYSHHFYPEWWKKLPTHEFDYDLMATKTNVKNCLGIIDYYKNGVTLPMWTDFALFSDNGCDWKSQFSDTVSELVWHTNEQRTGFRDDYQHFKFTNPWFIKGPKDVRFNFLPDFYNLNRRDFEITPGTIDYYYQHSTNINLLVPTGPMKIFIKFGTPLVNIIPLSEKELVLTNHLVTEAEHNKINARHRPIMFKKKAINFRKIIKEKEQAKCPFNFGKKV